MTDRPDAAKVRFFDWEVRHKYGDKYWATHRAVSNTAFDLNEHRYEISELLAERDKLKAMLAAAKERENG